MQGKSKISKRRESVSTPIKAFGAERHNTSYTSNVRHHRHGSWVDNLKHIDRRNLTQNLDSSFLSIDERGKIIPKTPDASLVAAQAYLFTTQPTPGDPRESMPQATLQGLGLVGNILQHRDDAPCCHVCTRHEGGT
jgi:hypothetical protein